MKKIVAIGELNPDLILQDYSSFPELGKEVVVRDCALTMGSATAICAVGLARLGNQVRFFARLGQDPYGEFCVRFLQREGIDVSWIRPDENLKTGITVSITGAKDRALVTYLGAMLELREENVTDELLASAQHVHMSSYYLQERLRPGIPEVLRRARRLGLTTSLDPGFDPSENWGPDIVRALEQVDVFFPNEVELHGITGIEDPAAALATLDNGHTLTVAKLGRRGAMAIENGAPVWAGAFPVSPVDTTGAGDSFNAGFLHRWTHGAPLAEALRFGAACGALSTLGFGGCGAQATEEQALEFLERHGAAGCQQ